MITFKAFLNEKAMNRGEFAKVEGRQGENAKVGFEFECFVTENSPLIRSGETERDYVSLNQIDSLDELSQYFIMGRTMTNTLESEYSDFFDREGNEPDWLAFVDKTYGSIYRLVKDNDLKPRYGWEADTGNSAARVYSEEMDDELVQKETYSAIEVDLSNFLGANVTTPSYRGAQHHYDKGDWLVVPDSSIEPDNMAGVGVEINAPPQPLNKALKDLATMFKWMNTNGIDTNESTGLHINISMPNIQDIDLVKLVLFMGDKYVLKQFDRVRNEYTRAQSQAIINNVTGYGTLPRDAAELRGIALDALSNDKYSSVNIKKLKQGYLEFRIAGNTGYQHKYDLVKDTVLRFVSAMEIACDVNAEHDEYLKKLTKILNASIESDSNPDFDKRPIIDVLEMGDEEMTKTNLERFLDQAKKGQLSGPSAHQRVIDWIEMYLLPGIQRAFGELSILKPSDRHRADLKLILKRLGVRPDEISDNLDAGAAWTVRAFSLQK